jgi:hypothetical protein
LAPTALVPSDHCPLVMAFQFESTESVRSFVIYHVYFVNV